MTDLDEIVYVVDDDPAVRKALARLLRSAGLAIETFASATEFLAPGRSDHVGCIVLDVRMPGQDGMALQADLAAQCVDLPIVFLTGHGDIPMTVEAMKQGAVDFLTKPVDEEVLRCVITGALNKQIAARLGIAEKTVKIHRARVMEKLGVTSVAELVQSCQHAGVEPLAGRRF